MCLQRHCFFLCEDWCSKICNIWRNTIANSMYVIVDVLKIVPIKPKHLWSLKGHGEEKNCWEENYSLLFLCFCVPLKKNTSACTYNCSLWVQRVNKTLFRGTEKHLNRRCIQNMFTIMKTVFFFLIYFFTYF